MTDTVLSPQAPPDAAAEPPADAADALVGRLFTSAVGSTEILCNELGLRLGLYARLRDDGPLTPSALAGGLGLDERYVAEWLMQQATAGMLTADGADSATARYALAPGVAEVMLDPDSLNYLAPIGGFGLVASRMLPAIEQAIRTGQGVPYADYGPEAVRLQEAMNRPAFLSQLADEWLTALPDLRERLADPTRSATVADVGCGAGWSTIALAEAFPHLRPVGIDSDATSIERARANAEQRGVADRVQWLLQPGESGLPGGPYDLVTVMECLHDMSHPVQVLAAARAALTEGGAVLVVDENTAESFTPGADELERFFAAVSVLWCLPQSREDADSAALGTCLRPSTVVRLAAEAGFSQCTVLPVENMFFRFYRLDP